MKTLTGENSYVPGTVSPIVDVADRVRAVREKVGLSQADLAARSGLDRIEVNQIERGKNQCGTWRIRAGLAKGLGVRVDTLAAYIDGAMDLEGLLARIRAQESDGTMRAMKFISERSEWAQVLDAARSAAAVSDPELVERDWGNVGQVYDGPSIPLRLTPRLLIQLARALRTAP